MPVLEILHNFRKSGKKGLAVLLDPDKESTIGLKDRISKLAKAEPDFFFVGGSLITLSELGELRVSSVASKGATLIRKYQVADGATWAHPVISGNRILIRDASSLRLWLLG